MKGKIRFLGLIMVLALAVCVISGSGWAQKGKPPKPPVPPADPAIVYIKTAARTSSLMVMNADGTNQRAVLAEKGFNYGHPDWSPDGTKLVFERGNGKPADSGLYTVYLDGTGLTRVSPSGIYPKWSPVSIGGAYRIAFLDVDDVYVVNLDGSGRAQLTRTADHEWSVEWSPSGQYIATWASLAQGPLTDDVIVYQVTYADGEFGTSAVTSISSGQNPPLQHSTYWDIDWANTAANENKLVVSADTEYGSYDLWVADIFNPALTFRLTETPPNTEYAPSWSPGDTKIAYIKGPEGGLWIHNVDGSGSMLIGYGFTQPEWRRNQ